MTDLTTGARAAVQRLSGLPLERIDVEVVPQDREGFDVVGVGDRLRITATSPVAAVAGYAQFARRTGQGSVSRSGVRPLATIPDGARHAALSTVPRRVAYNLTVGGYTTPFFSWSDWERELDLLAASSINAAHITVGQEAVWLGAFQRFGYTEQEMLSWIVPPSHQAWMWLNNVQGFGGGTSRPLIETRVELGRKVLERMGELGIEPILPGFSGSVPPEFAAHVPSAVIVPQGRWAMDVAGPMRPDWLDTSTPEYGEVAAAFYAEQHNLFGVGNTWAVDLLHEGGKIGDASLADAARGVETAMRKVDPDYTWVLQAWGGNPREELLGAIDRDHLLVLDLTGEHWTKVEAYTGTAWAWGILPNYGGRTSLYGDLRAIAQAPTILNGDQSARNVVGITDMAEGVANNPIVWDLLHDLTWQSEPVDLDAWTQQWITARYGEADPDAVEAWRILQQHAYGPWRIAGTEPMPTETLLAMSGTPVDPATVGELQLDSPFQFMAGGEGEGEFEAFQFYAGTDSIIGAVPSVHANQASGVGPRKSPYPNDALVPALAALLSAAGRLDATPSLEYDLVDVARQTLVDTARIVLPRVEKAFEVGDLDAFDAATGEFLELVDGLEQVLATHRDFRLDTWVHGAEALTDDDAERRRVVEWGLRLLTVWGDRDAVLLEEYSTRDWAGLVGGYYRGRWTIWFEQLRKGLRGEPTVPVDWYAYADDWLAGRTWADAPLQRAVLPAAQAALELVRRLA